MTTNFWRCATVGLLAAASLFGVRSEASVVIGGTRVVYPSQDKEITVKLTNQGASPELVQVWMDSGDEKSTPDSARVPFTLTPPIFRMEPNKGQAVRVMYSKEPLPTDRESLFWINMLEVPPKSDNPDGKNLMQFAFRTRIKFFFRPAGLTGDVATAPDKLSWKLLEDESGKGLALQVSNPTPYYVNFSEVGLKVGPRFYEHKSGGMVAPGATSTFKIPGLLARPVGDVKAKFDVINDYGAIGPHEVSV
jgi:chaperone protein EcpD